MVSLGTRHKKSNKARHDNWQHTGSKYILLKDSAHLDFQTKSEEIKSIRVPVDDNVQANILPYFQVSLLRGQFLAYFDHLPT